ncbi:hypothetical protein [Burkholderia sp. Ac-20365]|nr:hypothetical protein [Burkholderia sp. Ac-20365]MBN3761126.1 hypothetical protein [Burkholderia sp. Ac-20365]
MEEQLFDELVKSLREAGDIAQGKAEPSRSFVLERQLNDDKPASSEKE